MKSMFDNIYGDNTWVFAGGETVQGDLIRQMESATTLDSLKNIFVGQRLERMNMLFSVI